MIQRTGRLSVKQEIIHQMRPARGGAAASENTVRQQKSYTKLDQEEMMHHGKKK